MYIEKWKFRLLVYGFLTTMAVFSFSLWKNYKTTYEAFGTYYYIIARDSETVQRIDARIWEMFNRFVREKHEEGIMLKKPLLANMKASHK